MAVITGTVTGIHGIAEPAGSALNVSGAPVFGAYLTFKISGTYAQGGGNQAQLLAVPTTVQSFLHNGKTITLIQAAMAAPGDENGTPIGTGQITVSGANMTFPLTGGDLATEHANGALATLVHDIQIFVSYTET